MEIEYRLRWIEDYELGQRDMRLHHHPDSADYETGPKHFDRDDWLQMPSDLIAKSRLVEIQDDLYDTKNVFQYYQNINNYIVDPAYAQERAKLTKAFNDTPTDSLNNPSTYWKPKSWFAFTSNGAENNLEDFLKESRDETP